MIAAFFGSFAGNIVLFIVGLLLLIKGGDWFVDGATGIAERFHVPELLIGATVVSIGTTLPEVMVSASSAAQGLGDMAYGNAIGSIICNTALVAALTIAIKPSKVERKSLFVPVAFFFAAAAIYVVIAYSSQYFSRTVGIILLLIFAAYMILNIRDAVKGSTIVSKQADTAEESESEDDKKVKPMWLDILLLVVGAALITLGANLLIDNGTAIASYLGVPNSVIALTFVALGTSLPELVTAITSLAKGHGALSLGNIIGANLFNLVLVSGLSITIAPFSIPAGKTIGGINASLVMDMPIMLAVMLIMTVPTLLRGKLSRVQGILLLAIYAGFCAFQFVM
ncbi:MAG: calcium/sodium antiporter [Lachnospiraceae bacterium]|nr:calcium/sodium antiporter [Candidatus Colinaster equi]